MTRSVTGGWMHWLQSLVGPGPTPRVRAVRVLLLSVLVLACLVRLWLVFAYPPMDSIWSDPGRHWRLGTMPLDTQPFAAIDPVGYSAYLAVVAKLTAGSPLLVSYWTALLSLAGPWVWYRFLRELLPRDWALAGWAVLAALPSWSIIYSYFMQETLLLPLLGAALWATWRCRRKADTGSFLLAVFAWTCAGLTRGICIPLAAVAMTWLWIGQTRKLEKAALSLVMLLSILGPLAGRSWYLARQLSPHGIGTLNQLYARAGTAKFSITFTRRDGSEKWTYWFQSPAIGTTPLEPFSDWETNRRGHAHFNIDLDHGARDWKAEMESLPRWTLSRRFWLTGDNLVHLFLGKSWPDSNRERTIGLINIWMRWIWLPLILACLIAAVRLRGRNLDRLLPALMLTWFVLQGLVPLAVNEGRYRKPFEGLLIAQSLVLAYGLAGRRRDRIEASSIGADNRAEHATSAA